MTQSEIDNAVARTLREDISEVQEFGFSLLEPDVEFCDPECDCQEPQVLDWDAAPFESGTQSFHHVTA